MTQCSEVVGQMHLPWRLMAWGMCSNLHVRASCDNQGVPTNLTWSIISSKKANRCNMTGELNGASAVIDSMRLRRGDQEHVAQPTAADYFRISLPHGRSTARRAPATRTLCDSLKRSLRSMGKQCPLRSRTSIPGPHCQANERSRHGPRAESKKSKRALGIRRTFAVRLLLQDKSQRCGGSSVSAVDAGVQSNNLLIQLGATRHSVPARE